MEEMGSEKGSGRPSQHLGGPRADRGRALRRAVHEGTLSGQLVWKQMVEKPEPPRTRWAVFSGQLHAPQLETEVSGRPCV